MTIFGLLLVLGVAGLSLAVIWANDGVYTASAGTIELFGRQAEATVGQTFFAGAAAGALALLGLLMLFGGLGRSARRRSAIRHELRDQRQQMQDLQRKQETASPERAAAHRAATDNSAEAVGASSRR